MDKIQHANLSSTPVTRPFYFKRYGSTYHLEINGVEDLKQVLELDEAHWVATNAPIETINADPVFLQLLDTNNDGRIQTAEVKEGIIWLFDHLQDTSRITPGNTILDISTIRRDPLQGKRIYSSAMKIFRRKNSSVPACVTLEEVRQIKKKEEEGGIDKEGLALPTAAPNEGIRNFLEDIIATVGGEPHPSGATGVTLDCLEQFQKEIRLHYDWAIQGELAEEQALSEIMPFGKQTPGLYMLFSDLKEKINQYFALCSAVRFSQEIAGQIRQKESQLQELEADAVLEYLAMAPLASPSNDWILNFEEEINPYYAEKLEQFRTDVLTLMLGETPKQLSWEQWRMIKRQFEPYQKWFESKPNVSVEGLPSDKLQRYLDNEENVEALRQLIQESYKIAFDLDNIRLVEKLILYQAYMIPFVNSFVSFPHLYDPNARALFEMGTLIMDGRHFTLSINVPNREQHLNFCKASSIFVLYVEISDREGEKLYEVAVPVTSGMRGNLQVNKRGIFHDIHGRNLHAKVVHIVENSISFFEAISSPFRRLGNAITTKLDEMSIKAQEKLEAISTQAITTVGTEPAKQDTKPPAARPASTAGGLLAGGGIAIAALSSSFAFITKTFAGLSWFTILAGLFGAAMAVMLPTGIAAGLKLMRRDLSAILEGSGWGINARMKLTRKQARTFTFKPPYPPSSKGIVRRRYRWFLALLLGVLIIVWFLVSIFKN